MSVENVDSSIRKVEGLLRINNFNDEADRLALLVQSIDHPSEAHAAMEQIRAMCSIKWLGDYPISEVTLDEWLKILEEVKVGLGNL